MPVARRGAEGRPWQSRLAAWFAVVLTIAPFARPPLPVTLAPAPASSAFASAARDRAVVPAQLPAQRVRPAQPFDFGVLARWSWLESKPGLSPAPPATGRPRAADRALAVPGAIRAQVDHPRAVFHLSSIGTARRPTGPPTPASASA